MQSSMWMGHCLALKGYGEKVCCFDSCGSDIHDDESGLHGVFDMVPSGLNSRQSFLALGF